MNILVMYINPLLICILSLKAMMSHDCWVDQPRQICWHFAGAMGAH